MTACVGCGACCASFRVDFSVLERMDQGGQVPVGLTVDVTTQTCRMRGTDHQPVRRAALTGAREHVHDTGGEARLDHQPVRCAALTGKLGEQVACGIYEWRPSPCREFAEGSDACLRARYRHGLGPLQANMSRS